MRETLGDSNGDEAGDRDGTAREPSQLSGRFWDGASSSSEGEEDTVEISSSAKSLRYRCKSPVSVTSRDLEDKRWRKKEEKRKGQRWAAVNLALSSPTSVSASSISSTRLGDAVRSPVRNQVTSSLKLPVLTPSTRVWSADNEVQRWTMVYRRRRFRSTGASIGGAPLSPDSTEKLQLLPHAKMLDLFQKDYIHAVTVGVGLMVLQQFGGVNAICFYASEIFVSAGFSSGNTGMLAMVVVQIPMTTLGVLLLDKAGRRPLPTPDGLCSRNMPWLLTSRCLILG